jgi:hypothetical protein
VRLRARGMWAMANSVHPAKASLASSISLLAHEKRSSGLVPPPFLKHLCCTLP